MSSENTVICAAGHLCGMPDNRVNVSSNPYHTVHHCVCCSIAVHGCLCAYKLGGDDMSVKIVPHLLPPVARGKIGDHHSWICKLCYESTHRSISRGSSSNLGPGCQSKQKQTRKNTNMGTSASAHLLRSRGKDSRLCGGSNGIQYNEKEDENGDEFESDDSSSGSSSDVVLVGTKISSRKQSHNDDVSTTTKSTVNGKSSENPHKSITKLSPNIQSRMESKLGTRDHPGNTSTHSRDKMIQHANSIIGNRNSILQAAMKVGEDFYQRVATSIPKGKQSNKEKRSAVVIA